MRTYKTREGKFVSEKPKEYLKGFDSHGNEVFIGDTMIEKDSKKTFKVYESTWSYEISISVLKKPNP